MCAGRAGRAVDAPFVGIAPDEARVASNWTWFACFPTIAVHVRGFRTAVALMHTLDIVLSASPRVTVAFRDTVLPKGVVWQGHAIARADNVRHKDRAALTDAWMLRMAEKALITRIGAGNVGIYVVGVYRQR